MPRDIGDWLADIAELIPIPPRLGEAEEQLSSLIAQVADDDLRAWEDEVRRVVAQFLPKRRRRLAEQLDARLGLAPAEERETPETGLDATLDKERLTGPLVADLKDLSDFHIFQWSTFYRDKLSVHFERFLDAVTGTTASEVRSEIASLLHDEVRDHASEIFQKGYDHVTNEKRQGSHVAITKSLSGLQRFLDLPIEFYSARLFSGSSTEAVGVRLVGSAMLAGILSGYSNVSFGPQPGSTVLAQFPRSWGHALAFLRGSDLASVLSRLDSSTFRTGVQACVLPLAEAIDHFAETRSGYVPYPVLAQLSWDARRLEVGLLPPAESSDPRRLEVQCHLDPASIDGALLDDAVGRGVSVVIAVLSPEFEEKVARTESLRPVVVPAGPQAHHAAGERVVAILEATAHLRRAIHRPSRTLQYNIAKHFPLENPFLTRFYHVYRSSVRELLRTFERRNGVRLWCSVRRSGKTTACQDLASATGKVQVIVQTCDQTGQIPNGTVFYDALSGALERGKQLGDSFLFDAIEQSGTGSPVGERLVFILDEYEILFGRLLASVLRDRELRYTVAQPLMDQMVRFARDNLLVFLGQQPNAHFILMDHNQLSPYVEQDAYPLFRHRGRTGISEFGQLIQRVLQNHVRVDDGFVEAVFAETAGHPYLTVNLLREFVEWLIEAEKVIGDSILTEEEFTEFTRVNLTAQRLGTRVEYRFFRDATIAEALSTLGRDQNPWLHAVYLMLREICRASPDTLACDRADFDAIAEHLGLPALGFHSDLILSTAGQANFLEYSDERVWPRVRLLGRLAAVARPPIRA
jgi:hypothetical protein